MDCYGKFSFSRALVVLGLGVGLGASLAFAQPAWCIDVDVAEAPTNDLALTVNAINSAQKTLQLNIYELSSQDIADALTSRIQAGVQVQILEEGQPVGGMSTASKGIVAGLVQAMQSAGNGDFLYEMTSKATPKVKRRFRYDHAKYMVIDGSALLVGSENYSPTGNPEPGSVGNRGWEVFVHDADLAQKFASMFVSDSDPSHGDVMDMSSQSVAYVLGFDHHKPKPVQIPSPFPPLAPSPVANRALADAQPLAAAAVNSFTSPDTSRDGLVSLLNSATKSIDIELMTFNSAWGKTGEQSPLLAAVIAAAQRGVQVRVLLNDESVFNDQNFDPDGGDVQDRSSKPINPVTIQALQDAAAQGLPIQALVANIKAMGVDYIHNKGAIIDGDLTMISSINWDENSVDNNREAAVVITSSDVFNHYEALFEQDWEASSGSSSTAQPPTQVKPALDLLLPANGTQTQSVNCPKAVEVAVQIGQIAPQTGEDASFTALSGQSFDLVMSRDRMSNSCIFISSDHATKKRVFEIRDSHGETLFILEGYTSSGKVYSIRARSNDDLQPDQSLDARVYEGSGGHAVLGDAEMDIHVRF